VNGAGITSLMDRVVTLSTAAPAAEEATLPGIPASAGAARRFVARALDGCPRAEDVVLAASELAANAITHSASGNGGMLTVRVRTAPRWARVEVTDHGPARMPGHRNGWGLVIVKRCCDRSGTTRHSDGRRTAWAEVTWPAI
jgi:anti-sigma regulatory factor (Ser/Thr protein kinase)